MTVPAFSVADYLGALLRSRITIDNVRRVTFSPKSLSTDEVVTTHRLILILDGRLSYQVDDTTIVIEPGQQIFIPAWTRRIWCGLSHRPIEFIWVTFSASEIDDILYTPFRSISPQLLLEEASLGRMLQLWPQRLPSVGLGRSPCPLGQMDQLLLEAELKAILARFWVVAKPLTATGIVTDAPDGAISPSLKFALAWLHKHYLEPDALQTLYRTIELSPNHFRLLFRRAVGCSPQEHLHRLRLRRARHLVLDTEMQFKRIAAEVGFKDPLFFSRQYHQFWGASPRQERQNANQAKGVL